MKSDVTKLDPTKVKLTVEIGYDELGPALKHAYEHIAQEVTVPGFRKGKVPPRIIDQRFGKGAALEHAINDALPGFYSDAINEAGLHPLMQPEVDVTQVPDPSDEAGDLIFTAEVEVRPEIEIPDLSALTVEVSDAEVSDADVEARLDALRARFGTLTGVDRPAEDGDFVQIDLTATIDDDEVESVTGISYQIGSGTLLDGLDEALIGLSAGETTTFEAPLAGGDHAGEDAHITVTPTQVKQSVLPEANDEFAEMASEFDTIEELRANLREQATRTSASRQAVEAQDAMLDKLVELADFPVPEGVLNAQIDELLRGDEDDEAREEAAKRAEEQVRTQLLLDALVEKLEVSVTQQELVDYLLRSAGQYGMEPNEFIQMLDSSGQVSAVVAEVGRGKALTLALRQVQVTDASGSAVDLTPVIGSDEEDQKAAAAAEVDAAVAAAAAGPDVADEAIEDVEFKQD